MWGGPCEIPENLDVQTGEEWIIAGSCDPGCRYHEYWWDSQGLWVAKVDEIWIASSSSMFAQVYLNEISEEGELETTYVISDTMPTDICPTAFLPLPDNRLVFAHQPLVCWDRDPEIVEPGLFVLSTDGAMERMTSLTLWPWNVKMTIFWSPDHSVFLYAVGQQDSKAHPYLIGLADGSALWDIREFLGGATDFRWIAPDSQQEWRSTKRHPILLNIGTRRFPKGIRAPV